MLVIVIVQLIMNKTRPTPPVIYQIRSNAILSPESRGGDIGSKPGRVHVHQRLRARARSLQVHRGFRQQLGVVETRRR